MKRFVSSLLTLAMVFSVVLVYWPSPSNAANHLLLNFVVMSDPHIEGGSAGHPRVVNLVAGLKDTSTYLPKISAILIAGDLTENANEDQYKSLTYALDLSPTQNFLLTMGNHDAGREQDGDFKAAYDMYLKHCGKYLKDVDTSVPYYDKWINGYHFIVLCTEGAEWDGAYISDKQLTWFEEKLAEGAKDGKPIFVMCHQALNYTHPRTDTPDNQIGPAGDKIKDIIKKYPQVIYMSGHTHNGFGYSPVVSYGEGTFIDIPPMRGTTAYGYESSGVYWYVRVYEDYVIFSARDFTSNKWLPAYDIKINTKDIMPAHTPTANPSPRFNELEDNVFEILADSGYSIDNSYITGISEMTNADTLMSAFKNKERLTIYDNKGRKMKSDAFVGTGSRIRYLADTGESSERHIIVRGDIDGDGQITTSDYLSIKYYFQGKYQIPSEVALAADVDNNGRMDSRDYLNILPR